MTLYVVELERLYSILMYDGCFRLPHFVVYTAHFIDGLVRKGVKPQAPNLFFDKQQHKFERS